MFVRALGFRVGRLFLRRLAVDLGRRRQLRRLAVALRDSQFGLCLCVLIWLAVLSVGLPVSGSSFGAWPRVGLPACSTLSFKSSVTLSFKV